MKKQIFVIFLLFSVPQCAKEKLIESESSLALQNEPEMALNLSTISDPDRTITEGLPVKDLELDSLEFQQQCGAPDSLDIRSYYQPNEAQPIKFTYFRYNDIMKWRRAHVLLQWKSEEEIKEQLGYEVKGNIWDKKWCTGTVIAENLVLTAGHCFLTRTGQEIDPRRRYKTPFREHNGQITRLKPKELVPLFKIVSDYERDKVTGNITSKKNDDNVVVGYKEFSAKYLDDTVLDYAIIEVRMKNEYVPMKISPVDLEEGKPAAIIHHPGGGSKRISVGDITSFNGLHYTYSDIDTLGGSSGAPIINRNGEIVGVHLYGGCRDEGGNRGIRIEALKANSPVLRSLMARQ
jgi:hypothetical protein